MKLKYLSLVAVVGLVISSCNSNYKKTKDGLAYKIFSNDTGKKLVHGQLLKVHFSNKIADSTLDNTFERVPAYGRYDSSLHDVYDFVDFLGEMKVGDSAVYSRSVDTMVKKGLMRYTDLFKKGDVIKGTIKIVAGFANENALKEDQENEMKLEKAREIAKLETYLKSKNITPTLKTNGGVFVVVEKEGDGPKVDSGSAITVNYTGYLKSGSKFDSNLDTAFHHVEPFQFTIGTQSVIPGWDEGMKAFKKGGKGKLYVPAMMAYGMQGQGERLPAFSDLIFDVEVVDVKAATVAVQEKSAPAPIK